MDLAEARKRLEQAGLCTKPVLDGTYVGREIIYTTYGTRDFLNIVDSVMIAQEEGIWWAWGDAITLGGSNHLAPVVEATIGYYKMNDHCTENIRNAMWKLQNQHLFAVIISPKEIRIRDIKVEKEDWGDMYGYMEHAIHSDNYQHTVILRLEEDGWDVIATNAEGNSESTHVESLDDAVEKAIAICRDG